MAGGVGPPRAGGARPRPERTGRSGGADMFRTVRALPPSGAAEGARPRQGLEVDRRLALLRISGLERRVGPPGVVSARRPTEAALRRRRASRLFQRDGTALGQSHLQLACSCQGGLWLVDMALALVVDPRGRDSP